MLRRGPRLQKKLGEVVYKGHYSYSLMLELQLGIRYSVGRGLWPSTRSSTTNLRALAGFTGVLAPWAPHGSGNGSGGGSKQQQQAQGQGGFKMLQASSKGGHQRTASDALTAEGGLRQLEALDFKEERTVYFPSCGRCVRGRLWLGRSPATTPRHQCGSNGARRLTPACCVALLPSASCTPTAPPRPLTPQPTSAGRTIARASSGGCGRQPASTTQTTCSASRVRVRAGLALVAAQGFG